VLSLTRNPDNPQFTAEELVYMVEAGMPPTSPCCRTWRSW
jgi:hypothetical protein